MPQQLYTTAGTYTWTVPAGVTSVLVECWGAGGAGQGAGFPSGGGGGGGGGAYAASTGIAVTPGANITVVVGVGGIEGVNLGTGNLNGGGGDSTFDGMTVVAKAGGGSVGVHIVTGGGEFGPGGQASDCIGDVTFSGGDSDLGSPNSNIGGNGEGAGGGSSAGTGSAGSNGVGSTPGFAPAGGGDGGDGGVSGTPNGANGQSPGGGGGGGYGNGAAGASGVGADGQVRISWDTGGGGGGDPHFVGFDNLLFDYHGIPDRWYRLYKDEEVDVQVYFELAEHKWLPPESTFMTKAKIITADDTVLIDTTQKPKQLMQILGLTMEEAKAYSLPSNLRMIYGRITDIYTWSSRRLTIVVSRILRTKYKKHLNVHFKLTDKALEGTHEGIVGQTLHKDRVANDTFLIEEDNDANSTV